MEIRPIDPTDRAAWIELRVALWAVSEADELGQRSLTICIDCSDSAVRMRQ